jgi:hypothetical protein
MKTGNCWKLRETTKKIELARKEHSGGGGFSSHSLETFRDRLCDLCEDDIEHFGCDRSSRSQNQAQCAVAVAREFGCLKSPGETWDVFRATNPDLHFGTEHAVESDPQGRRMVKITIPPAFGLIPAVLSHPLVDLRNDSKEPQFRRAIEFLRATPLEYLDRWIAANEIFADEVELASVVEWSDGQISFIVLQPQYHGENATSSEIEKFFTVAGWTAVRDPSRHHDLFFNYAFGVLAIDALPRNCHVKQGELLPFDVILCRPDPELESFLKLYPG